MNLPDHRIGATDITVTDVGGTVLANAVVEVAFERHEFGFGNIGFDFADLALKRADAAVEHLADLYLEVFNAVTLPFYWRQFEPTQGAHRTAELKAAARWAKERGLSVKGHPLVWHTLAPLWLLDVDPTQVESIIRARAARETANFKGLVDNWDAINEAVIAPVFTAEKNAITPVAQLKGRVEMVRFAFESAREGDPGARLVLNDFDLSSDYEDLIEECLAAGIQIDALGLQTHMHQGFRGEEQITEILDRFGRFGLPLQLTETTLVSGDLMPAHIVDLNDYQPEHWPSTPEGEVRQADELERHYRTVFAHPAVESLTYWGLGDADMWLGAPAGLIRKDGSPKPAFDTLKSLVRDEWWTDTVTARTDSNGTLTVSGTAGTYRVTHEGRSAAVTVGRGTTKESGTPTRVALE